MSDIFIPNEEKIKDILILHQGKQNAITAKEISRRIGLPLEDTQQLTRSIIWRVARMYELPVIACSKGYFVATTQDEVDEYIDTINNRVNGMYKTVNLVRENFEKAQNK